MKALIAFVIVTNLSLFSLSAQQSIDELEVNHFVELKLNDGTEIIGEIIEITDNEIIIATASLGQINVSKFQIKSIRLIDKDKIREDGTVYFDNPMPSRNYLTETAIGLKKGEGLYQNILLGAHSFSFGVSDRFTLSGGFETFSLFSGNTPIFFVAPKLTFPTANNNLHFGLGANLALFPDNGRSNSAGSLYGISTYGNKNHNITVGIGFTYVDASLSDTPVFQLGGMTRLGKHFMIVTDNVLAGDSYNTYVVGTWTIRYITQKTSIDIGIATAYLSGGAGPVLGASIRF